MINGRDWASYQGPTPDTTGLDFAFIKVTQGLTYTNPDWQRQVDHAKAAGLVVGLYHYPDMRNGATTEAQHFIDTCGVRGLDAMLCLDWEGYDADNRQVTHGDQARYKDAFLAVLQALRPGNRSVLYANLDYWTRVDTTGRYGDALWIATSGKPAGAPGIATPWLFHQYAVTGGVDQDVANFPTRAALQAWANKTEDDMPLTAAEIDAVATAAAEKVWSFMISNDAGNLTASTHLGRANVFSKLALDDVTKLVATAGVGLSDAQVQALATELVTAMGHKLSAA